MVEPASSAPIGSDHGPSSNADLAMWRIKKTWTAMAFGPGVANHKGNSIRAITGGEYGTGIEAVSVA